LRDLSPRLRWTLAAVIPVDIVAMGFGCGGCHRVCFSLLAGTSMLTSPLLEVGKYLSQGRLTGLYHPATCARAASACGSQKVISMARYKSIAVASSARACSCWPVLAYRVPRP